MNYDQWRTFFNRKTGDVYSDWTNQVIPHLVQLKINCPIIFRYHHVRKKDSRKKQCCVFTARGRCKLSICPVTIDVEVEDEPKSKGSPCMFKVIVSCNPSHDPKKETASRPMTGIAREQMGIAFCFLSNLRLCI